MPPRRGWRTVGHMRRSLAVIAAAALVLGSLVMVGTLVVLASPAQPAPRATATIPAGTRPWLAAVNPVTNTTYVVNEGVANGTVTVIDGATNAVITTVAVGVEPLGVAVNATTNKVYVTDSVSDTVT